MKKVEDVKKNKKKQTILDELSESDDFKLSQRIIDLCLWYQIEDSHNMIRLFGSEIKMYEAQKQALLNNCIFRFQKKKVEKELEEIDNKIHKLYENISDEVSMISKMEESISRDETSECNISNKLVSYYELLSLLKMGVKYEKVILHKFETLKEYTKKYNVNFRFVRDYDKNDSLYLCNTEYTENMENDNWILLKEIF